MTGGAPKARAPSAHATHTETRAERDYATGKRGVARTPPRVGKKKQKTYRYLVQTIKTGAMSAIGLLPSSWRRLPFFSSRCVGTLDGRLSNVTASCTLADGALALADHHATVHVLDGGSLCVRCRFAAHDKRVTHVARWSGSGGNDELILTIGVDADPAANDTATMRVWRIREKNRSAASSSAVAATAADAHADAHGAESDGGGSTRELASLPCTATCVRTVRIFAAALPAARATRREPAVTCVAVRRGRAAAGVGAPCEGCESEEMALGLSDGNVLLLRAPAGVQRERTLRFRPIASLTFATPPNPP